MSGSSISLAICKSAPCSRQTTTPALHHCFFTGRMPFLLPNQQRQSTEGSVVNKLITGTVTYSAYEPEYLLTAVKITMTEQSQFYFVGNYNCVDYLRVNCIVTTIECTLLHFCENRCHHIMYQNGCDTSMHWTLRVRVKTFQLQLMVVLQSHLVRCRLEYSRGSASSACP